MRALEIQLTPTIVYHSNIVVSLAGPIVFVVAFALRVGSAVSAETGHSSTCMCAIFEQRVPLRSTYGTRGFSYRIYAMKAVGYICS